jgi:hypothetical protein
MTPTKKQDIYFFICSPFGGSRGTEVPLGSL